MGRATRATVSETCLANRGEDGAIDEALRRLKVAAREVLDGWGRPLKCKMHFDLVVERPEDPNSSV